MQSVASLASLHCLPVFIPFQHIDAFCLKQMTFENSEEKVEMAQNEQFPLLPQCFQLYSIMIFFWQHFEVLSHLYYHLYHARYIKWYKRREALRPQIFRHGSINPFPHRKKFSWRLRKLVNSINERTIIQKQFKTL